MATRMPTPFGRALMGCPGRRRKKPKAGRGSRRWPRRPRILVHPDDPSDPMVLETGGEDVRRAVAAGVGDQHDGAVVLLAHLVGRRRIGDGKGLGIGGPGAHGLIGGLLPGFQAEIAVRAVGTAMPVDQRTGHGVGDELHPFRLDPGRRQGLKQHFTREDEPAAVAADVEDQSVPRHQRQQPDELVQEQPFVVDTETCGCGCGRRTSPPPAPYRR